MLDQLLAALTEYGSPALFLVVAIAAIGVPVPVTLLLIVTGSLAAQGSIDIWSAIVMAAVGSVAGDQIGFAVGRWGGKGLASNGYLVTPNASRNSMPKRRAGVAPEFSSAAGSSLPWDRGSTSPVAPRITLGFNSPCGIF
jgi:membrane protein YqaA with SNARE-associated domain